MIEHRSIVRLLFNDRIQFNFNQTDVWTMFHSYCFDFSVWEMYGALLYGGKLVIVSKITAQEPSEYLKLLKNNKVTILNQTPTAFRNLMSEELNFEKNDLTVRNVIFGGEELRPGMLREWKERYPGIKMMNMYGITETTVHVTYKEITEEEIKTNVSNIGKPIPTLTTYIIDRDNNLTPIGIAGELCISGIGLARGYLNQPELTKEKFVANPFIPGERMYRTGDLARWLPDGNIEFLERIDHKENIKGYRIELGEIESHLLKHKKIKEAVVLAREDKTGSKYLCAYIVSDEEISLPELREYLAKELPEYMIPSYFIPLKKLPLTPNGKVDRKALPELDGNINTGTEYEAPRNEIEEKLAEVWQKVLDIEKVGINDDFFELGGHSLT